MKISDILKQRGQGVSFEFFPPKTQKGKDSLTATVGVLKNYKPLYVSMTCGAGGLATQDKTKEAVSLLLEHKELVVMPHLTCLGVGRGAIESLLEKYKKKGIENIMALRGDPPQDRISSDYPAGDFLYGVDLVKVIKKYNYFCIGVAVYPEGHIESPTLEEDLEYTKQKIEAGAEFAVTQMFFDNTYFYAFQDRMKSKRINIPILPGILPLTNLAKVEEFASICRVTIPKQIKQILTDFKDNTEDQEKAGIEFTIKQCRDLKENGFKRLHFFTLNKPRIMKAMLDALSI